MADAATVQRQIRERLANQQRLNTERQERLDQRQQRADERSQ